VDVLHHSRALFPLKNPGLFSMAGSFLVGILVSRFTHDLQAEEKFAEETVRSCIGGV
jgi:cation/acetate symporter